tara:strand:+ start:1821 stop:2102 length:282 start_codon:yes stop_codon:yes gene_type:complete
MDIRIELEKIDLSDNYLDLNFPSLEAEVRRMATEFVKGVLEENLRLDIQQTDGSGELYAVLWACLSDGVDTPIAEIPIDALFKEFLESKENKK